MKIELSEKEAVALLESLASILQDDFKKDVLSEEWYEEKDSESSETEDRNLSVIEGSFGSSTDAMMTLTNCQGQEFESKQEWIDQGEKAFNDLIELWMINFNQPGEQPPRVEKLEQLAQSFDGRAMIHYLSFIGGLSKAVWRTGLVAREQVRLVASNLSQVSSTGFYHISDYLEYPDPTSTKEFFNV